MATCGYLCPQCEGRGFIENGEVCDWCLQPESNKTVQGADNELSDEEWLDSVHNGPCCSDRPEEKK